jgi:PKD domain
MKLCLWIFAILMALLGCSSHQNQAGSESKSPRLVVNAQPRQGLSPHHASLSATLTGVGENDSEWYCLKEEWDFGDGSVSGEQPQCEPFTPETKIITTFFADHTYEDAGNYKVRFNLGDGKLRSNSVVVVVLESQIEKSTAN